MRLQRRRKRTVPNVLKLLGRLDRERVFSLNAIIRRMQSPGTATGKKADEMHKKWEAAYDVTFNELEACLEAERAHFDTLRQALEIIAVGDSKDPKADAAQALRAVGFWRKEPARA